jgi:hypothetical protein
MNARAFADAEFSRIIIYKLNWIFHNTFFHIVENFWTNCGKVLDELWKSFADIQLYLMPEFKVRALPDLSK